MTAYDPKQTLVDFGVIEFLYQAVACRRTPLKHFLNVGVTSIEVSICQTKGFSSPVRGMRCLDDKALGSHAFQNS